MSYFWKFRQAIPFNITGGAKVRSITLRKMEIQGQQRHVVIRLVEGSQTVDGATDLINDRYARKGYGSGHRIPISRNHMTFTAEVDDQVVATITLAVDSADGLAADRTFKQELDGFRARHGSKICELTKFAFSSDVHSKELMATLFHIVFVYGQRKHGCSDLLIEVNPRHVRFYEAMLGFTRAAPKRVNASVGAALQLMALEVATIRKNIDRCAAAGQEDSISHSLYPLFFDPADEDGVYERLNRAKRRPYIPSDVPDQVADPNSAASVPPMRGSTSSISDRLGIWQASLRPQRSPLSAGRALGGA